MAFKFSYLIGIDEVGRGPIAGPVTLGGMVVLHKDPRKYLRKNFRNIKDSKQLSVLQRIEWLNKIKKERALGNLDFQVSSVGSKIIDSKGLSYAIKLAIKRTLEKFKLSPQKSLILLDGGLRAPEKYFHQKTIIKGDEKEKIIAMASIVAKIHRDQKMIRFSQKYPYYGFEQHKGYGTKKHYIQIKKYGISKIHRLSFLK